MATKSSRIAETRARRRALGMRSTETVLREDEIATLDKLKARLGVNSRSEVLRVLIAKADRADLSPADVALLSPQSAA